MNLTGLRQDFITENKAKKRLNEYDDVHSMKLIFSNILMLKVETRPVEQTNSDSILYILSIQDAVFPKTVSLGGLKNEEKN